MKERTILHSDVNNFFASVEASIKPELSGKPIAVTGNPKKRTGIILAKNYIAKSFGVKTGQTIWEAKKLCPSLVCLPPHYDLYEKISLALHQIYLDYTEKVEPLGLDECWLDVTGCEKYLGKNGKQIADEIRERVKKQFGFSVSVGVSFNKIFAKLGSDLNKPDATTIIDRQNFKSLTCPMPLESIVGIGSRLQKKFKKIGVTTIGQYVGLDDKFLQKFVSIAAVDLKKQLLGIDENIVLSYYNLPMPKSVGNGSTAIKDIKSREEVEKFVYFLSQKVSLRLIGQNLVGKTIGISLKTFSLERFGKTRTLFYPTNSADEISSTCMEILDSFWDYTTPIRAARVRVSLLSRQQGEQMSMFDKKDPSEVIFQIGKKYGKIVRASDLEPFINRANHTTED